MLARLVYFIETPIGPYPTQIEYRDYREVEGRTVPYSWVISAVRNREVHLGDAAGERGHRG